MTCLALHRNEKGLTQKDMAKSLMISVSTYNLYENSKRKIPAKTAEAIVSILDIDIKDIFLPISFTNRKIKVHD